MSRWTGPEPPGKTGIDENNATQVRLVLAQKDATIATLRGRIEDLVEALEHDTKSLNRSLEDKKWQLSILAELIERSGIEPVTYNAAEVIALQGARMLLEAQRNKIIERVETALGKGTEEENHNDD